MTNFLDYCNNLNSIFKKPVLLKEIDPKFDQLDRALKLMTYEKQTEPYKDLKSIKHWRFRIQRSELLKAGRDIRDTPIDNYGNIISIRLCRRVNKPEFQFLWTLRKSEISDLKDEGLMIAENITNVNLRTSDEKQALTDIVYAFYVTLTTQKYNNACIPRRGNYIRYKGERHKVARAYVNKNEGITLKTSAFDITIVTSKKLKIHSSLDWEVEGFEDQVDGEVMCLKCKMIGHKRMLALRMIRGHGFFCGPCLDYLYETDQLKDNNLQSI